MESGFHTFEVMEFVIAFYGIILLWLMGQLVMQGRENIFYRKQQIYYNRKKDPDYDKIMEDFDNEKLEENGRSREPRK